MHTEPMALTPPDFNPTAEQVVAARRAVEPLALRLDLASQLRAFEPWSGPLPQTGLPTLHLDDTSGIPFLVNISGVELYQHRSRTRAGDRDLYAAVVPLTDGYEDYCQRHLGMGAPEFIQADPVDGPQPVARACAAGHAVERLALRAKAAGGLQIHPYMGIEEVWNLAREIARRAAVPVKVLGPAPPVTWIANDKGLLTEIVHRVLGSSWAVETRPETQPDKLAERLVDMAARVPQVGLKRTRCASAMGNIVYASDDIQTQSLAQVTERVRGFLTLTEWDGDEAVLAVEWAQTDISPSTQLWIPPRSEGPPQLDGIYEQILEGEARIFVGSRPATLPARVQRTVGQASLRLGVALQALGYVGRCSFDLLILGDPNGDFRTVFTECNGRWGGTSTPMGLLDRLVPRPRPSYQAQDYVHPDLVGARFVELLAAMGDVLYDPRTPDARAGRYIFYNVGPLAECGKLDVIAMGRNPQEAAEAVAVELPRRLGLR